MSTEQGNEIEVEIYEQGRGFPEIGDRVSMDGDEYRVTHLYSSTQTGDPRGNMRYGRIVWADGWRDGEADPHSARVVRESTGPVRDADGGT